MRLITYILLLGCVLMHCRSSTEPVKSIHLFAMEDVSPATMQYLQIGLQTALDIDVIIEKDPLNLTPQAWYALHKRYWADTLLIQIKKISLPQKGVYKMGITGKDISSSINGAPNQGIMGLSYQGGCCAIISDYRLHQMGRSRDSMDFYLLKAGLHEMGHCMGLGHCKVVGCIMEDVAKKHHITSIHDFCKSCKKEIHRR